jgi:ketosteroid isomerase-like protein
MAALADRFFNAAETGDIEVIKACYSPDLRAWHSRDEAWTDIAQNLELIQSFFDRVPDFHYEIERRFYTAEGFVQQHIVHGHVGDQIIHLPVCFVALVKDGLIFKLWEYFDASRSPMNGVSQDNRG